MCILTDLIVTDLVRTFGQNSGMIQLLHEYSLNQVRTIYHKSNLHTGSSMKHNIGKVTLIVHRTLTGNLMAGTSVQTNEVYAAMIASENVGKDTDSKQR